MIKNERGIYYITCGGACYIMREERGALYNVCFGKRVEYEDDMSVLMTSPTPELAGDDISVKRGGKKLELALTVAGSKVVQKPEAELPTLRGEKTLAVALEDKKSGIAAEILYTPYSRGGIAKRVRIVNTADTPLTVERLAVSAAMPCDTVCGEYGLWTAAMPQGEYAAFPLFFYERLSYKDGRATLAAIDKKTMGKSITLAAGEALTSAELVLLYSCGAAGATVRALHDIIREYAMSPEKSGKRRPIVLYCALHEDGAAFDATVAAACETGMDTVVVDYAADAESGLIKAAECVHAHGIKFGLRIAVDATASGVRDIIKKCGAEYLEFAFDGVTDHAETVKLYGAYAAFRKEFPDIVCDFTGVKHGAGSAALRSRAALPLPLAAVRNVVTRDGVKSSYKTEFDIATLGGLGYRLDPSKLDTNARRAVRAQIFSYQDDESVVMNGDVYDIESGVMVVSKDKSKAYAVATGDVRLVGLDEHNLYRVRELGKTFSGAALAYYGIPYDKSAGGETVTYHIGQVADYEQ